MQKKDYICKGCENYKTTYGVGMTLHSCLLESINTGSGKKKSVIPVYKARAYYEITEVPNECNRYGNMASNE